MRICSDVKTEKPFSAIQATKRDSLIEKQLITAEPTSVITQKGEKRNGNLRYTIRPIAEALEQYYEQQLIRLHEENRRQAALKKLAEFDRKHGKSAV